MVVWTQLRAREETTVSSPIDYVGIALLVLGVGLLQVVLDKGNDLDWFAAPEIIVMSVLSAIALVSFVIWELGNAIRLSTCGCLRIVTLPSVR